MSWEKIAQNVAQTILCVKINIFYFGKKWPKIVGYFYKFLLTAQNKQPLIGRKFAQSGHPECQSNRPLLDMHLA
jgi:hypothetical protein